MAYVYFGAFPTDDGIDEVGTRANEVICEVERLLFVHGPNLICTTLESGSWKTQLRIVDKTGVDKKGVDEPGINQSDSHQPTTLGSTSLDTNSNTDYHIQEHQVML